MSDRERVEALAKVLRPEVDRVLALFPMDEHGTGHIADCGFDADERCDCYTLPERIAGVLRDLLAEAKADALREYAVLADSRKEHMDALRSNDRRKESEGDGRERNVWDLVAYELRELAANPYRETSKERAGD